MYTETINTLDLPNGYKLAVIRKYQTAEAALASDADWDKFHDYALAIASEKFNVISEDYLDKPDKTDPDNCVRVWMFAGYDTTN